MTLGGWFGFAIISVLIVCGALAINSLAEEKTTGANILTAVIAGILIGGALAVMLWYYGNTAAGQRALKSQQSNFGGGIERTVTVYSLNGDEIRSWTGKFDVSENDQEMYFDIDGKRVIIQGGIIINEEVGEDA